MKEAPTPPPLGADRVRLPHRPAIDGLRAVAVCLVIIYHGLGTALPGGWLGVDVFFTISGFLITSLLLAEHRRTGSIGLRRFWLARARRLLPANFLLLLVVLVIGGLLVLPTRRPALSVDALSTMLYVANCRFLLSDTSYFDTLGIPSPLQHMWSLAVEEQYYLLYPFILLALLWVLRRQRKLLALSLLALAVASAWWMSHLYHPTFAPDRVYYGTDARAHELLLGGAVAALIVGGPGSLSPQNRTRVFEWASDLALPALVLILAASRWVTAENTLVFQGGLFLLTCLTGVVLLACVSPQRNWLQRVLSLPPLLYLGKISYGMYLWHWPIMVFLRGSRSGLGTAIIFLPQVALTIILAALSYRYLEDPIRRRGLAAFTKRPSWSPAVASSSAAALLVAILAMPSVLGVTAAATSSSGITRDLPQTPVKTRLSIAVLGNSVPASLAENWDQRAQPKVTLTTAATPQCELLEAVRYDSGKPQPTPEECRHWATRWPAQLRSAKPQVTTYFASAAWLLDLEVAGKFLRAGTPAHDSYLKQHLNRVREHVLALGVKRFAVMNLACHQIPDVGWRNWATRANDTNRVRHVNALVAAWGKSTGTPVIDEFSFLCPGGNYQAKINEQALYKDGLHFTPESSPWIWRWLLPQLQAIAAAPANALATRD